MLTVDAAALGSGLQEGLVTAGVELTKGIFLALAGGSTSTRHRLPPTPRLARGVQISTACLLRAATADRPFLRSRPRVLLLLREPHHAGRKGAAAL